MPRIPRAVPLAAIAALLLGTLLGGCASDADAPPSLVLGGSGLAGCLPGSDLTDGYIELPLQNTTRTGLVVSGVSVNSLMAASLTGSWILGPGTAGDDAGTTSAYFGTEPPAGSDRWDAREAALGASIPPLATVTLALEVHSDPGVNGAVRGVTVSYTDERGSAQLATSTVSLRMYTPDTGVCAFPDE